MIDINLLKKYEEESIDKTILIMAYNPSCGRIFSKEANNLIKDEIIKIIADLPSIQNQDQFDKIHKKIMDNIIKIKNYRENNRTGIITYGQAQKGLNVFLKVYVDWSNLPNYDIAGNLRNFLHCPLDSRVMNTLKGEENPLYGKYGNPPCTMKNIKSYEQYMSWQKIIRDIVKRSNEKPLIIDVIWHLKYSNIDIPIINPPQD